jgi:methylmalonyl-CoA mutase N-terminal domain/subunit
VFQEIERRGGLAAAYEWFCAEVAAVRSTRVADVANGTTPILGVSLYPPAGETVVEAEPWPTPAPPPRKDLPEMRLAAALEDAP